jgi:hypothetical protein
MLRNLFGYDREGVTGEWRKLNNEEFYDLYCTPDIIRVTKSRQTRWMGHVARTGAGEVHTGFWWGNLRESDYLEETGHRW